MWTTPSATEMRFGFEITMYVMNQELATKYSVRSVPTLVLIEDDVEISRSIGLKNTKELEAWANGQPEYQK